MFSRKQIIVFWLSIISIYIIAWFTQSHFLLPSDSLWQLQMSRGVLHGGTYLKNFFEITPPLFLYLTIPEIAIEKIFSVSHVVGLYIYIFILSTFLLCICYNLLRKIFSKNDIGFALVLLIGISFIFLILPLSAFGEREHYFVLLSMPYFLLLVCRIRNIKVSTPFAVMIGLLGAAGFFIKPYFLAAFILAELYTIFTSRKQKKYCWRPETFSVIIFLVFYTICIFIFFKPYVFTILPITLRFYYQSYGKSWGATFDSSVIFFLLLAIFLGFFYRKNSYANFLALLTFALIGNFVAYGAQKIPWYYHIFPALSIALLSMLLLLCILKKNNHSILVTLAVAFFLFYFPISYISFIYAYSISLKKQLGPLIYFLHKTEFHRPVYFLSAETPYFLSVINYAGAYHPSHFNFLVWMRDYYNIHFVTHRTLQQKRDANYLTGILATDFNHYKPDLVFVDMGYTHTKNGYGIHINYLRFLLQNKKFKSAWKKYHFLMSIHAKNLYAFNIYERNGKRSVVLPITSPNCKAFSACNAEFHTTALCSHKIITVEPNLK